jgi:hypothetical protein
MLDALLATALVVAGATAGLYLFVCATSEADIRRSAPEFAARLFRSYSETLFRAPPVRLSVLLRKSPPAAASLAVSPLRTLAIAHLVTAVVAAAVLAIWSCFP